MPTGILLDAAAIISGGLAGTALRNTLSDELKSSLQTLFGICALFMGIHMIALRGTLPPVILAVLLGYVTGFHLHIHRRLSGIMHTLTPHTGKWVSSEVDLVPVIILFCASATGIYGAMIAGMNGDQSILCAKALLDFFTAMVFASSAGSTICLIAIPQLLIFLTIFSLSRIIMPLTSASMLTDLQVCGGFIILVTGLQILKKIRISAADLLPALLYILPISYLWSEFILPLLS